MRFISATATFTCLTMFSFPLFSTEWGNFDLIEGDKFTYSETRSNGDVLSFTRTYKGKNEKGHHIFLSESSGSSGEHEYDSNMSLVSTTRYQVDTHIGYPRPSMNEGEEWSHSYDVTKRSSGDFFLTRRRECSSLGIVDFKVGSDSLRTYLLSCFSKKDGANSGRDEMHWIDTKTGIRVAWERPWTSDGFDYENTGKVVEISWAPR